MRKLSVIIVSLTGFLLCGTPSARALSATEYQHEVVETKYGSGLAKPLSATLPSENQASGNDSAGSLRNGNPWGGGDDMPDPEKDMGTGMEAPVSDALPVLLAFSLLFVWAKARARKQKIKI